MEVESSKTLANGFDEDTPSPAVQPASPRTILTLFGGDRQAKQLFSSLGKRKSREPDDISEQALPNGITTTKVIPTHSLNDDDTQIDPIFRDTFPPPPTLTTLTAPRPSKYTTSRSGPVTWYTPSVASRKTIDRRSFATQGLPTGSWLNYNAPPLPRQPSPESKRKQRDRALSFGETQSPMNDEAIAAHSQAKDDALFRSVYTSFAPDRDDSTAIIPTKEKDWMWYARYGQETYHDLLDLKYQMVHGDDDPSDDNYEEEPLNEDEIQEALKHWSPLQPDIKDLIDNIGTKDHFDKEAIDTEADEVLTEISSLLETLSSYQRIRFETLPTSTRSTTGSVPAPTGSSTHPATPSASERKIYDTLVTQLAAVVSQLPPYMLSKLDGDKLGALKVSTIIQTEGKNQKGTLQEDEVSAKARVAARTPVPAAVAQTPNAYSAVRPGSGYHQQTQSSSGHYTRPPYGAPVSASRPGMPHSYTSSQYASRPPLVYPPGSARPPYVPQTSYGAQRTPSYTERFTNGTAQYGNVQSYSSYANTSYRSQGQQASSYTPQYSTPQSRMPASTAAQLQAYRATPSGDQQRVAGTGPSFGYGSTPMAPVGSPQPTVQHRLSFSAHGQSPNAQRPPLLHQPSSNQGSRSPQPHANGLSAGIAGRMSPDDQAALVSRQKAQLAEATQQIRQSSGTPQPIMQNGGSQNGTPGVQQGRGGV